MAFALFNPCESCCSACSIPDNLCLEIVNSTIIGMSGLKFSGFKDERIPVSGQHIWSFYSNQSQKDPTNQCCPDPYIIELACCKNFNSGINPSPSLDKWIGATPHLADENNITFDGMSYSSTYCQPNSFYIARQSNPFLVSGVFYHQDAVNHFTYRITENLSPTGCSIYYSCCDSNQSSLVLRDLRMNVISTLTGNGSGFFTDGTNEVFCSGYQGYNWYYNKNGIRHNGNCSSESSQLESVINGPINGLSGNYGITGASCPIILPIANSGYLESVVTKSSASNEIYLGMGPVKKQLFVTITGLNGSPCLSSVSFPINFVGRKMTSMSTFDTPLGTIVGSKIARQYLNYGYTGSGIVYNCPANFTANSGAILEFLMIDVSCSGWNLSTVCHMQCGSVGGANQPWVESNGCFIGLDPAFHFLKFNLAYQTSSNPFYLYTEIDADSGSCGPVGGEFFSCPGCLTRPSDPSWPSLYSVEITE